MSIKSILGATGHALAQAGETVGKQAVNVLAAPGKAIEMGARVDSAAVDAVDRKLEGSKLGNNVAAHLVGGLVEAPVQALLGVADGFGALIDGRLETAAVKTGIKVARNPTGELAQMGASLVEHFEDDFSSRPAHSLGAAVSYLSGFGMGPSLTGKLVGKLRRGHADAPVAEAAAAPEAAAVPAVAARGPKLRRALAKASRVSQEASIAERNAGKLLNKKIARSNLPVVLKVPMQVPGLALQVSGRATDLISRTAAGRVALSAAPKKPSED